ncbi:hypothetical protein ACO0RG_001587 [Hanseniaspora osmophila]
MYSFFHLHKSCHLSRQVASTRYKTKWSKTLGTIAKRLISACDTELIAEHVLPFFDIFPLAITLGWVTGFEGKHGGVIKDYSKFCNHSVSCILFSSSDSLVSDLAITPDTPVMCDFYAPYDVSKFEKWYFVGPLYIAFVDEFQSADPKNIFKIDSEFDFEIADEELDELFVHKKSTLTLKTKDDFTTLLFESQTARNDCAQAITDMMKQCEWTKMNRYNSFAPVRSSNYCKAYVDASDYFQALAQAIDNASKCIFIYGKLFSMDLHMKRATKNDEESSINGLLLKKHLQGVKIYTFGIGPMMEFPATPYETRTNVEIIESDEMDSEKRENFLVIDYNLGFFGEIALSFGRYDTSKHLIFDRNKLFDGKTFFRSYELDYRENCLYDLASSIAYAPTENNDHGNVAARMPWHDTQLMVFGPVARDLCRVFTQRWNDLAASCRYHCHPTFNGPFCDLTKEQTRNILAQQDLSGHSECECQLLPNVVNQPYHSTDGIGDFCIQNAYCGLILSSKHCVYIEDESLVTFEQKTGVWETNKLGDALYDRIMKAHNTGQKWRAVILLPLRQMFTYEETEDNYKTRKMASAQYSASSATPGSVASKLEGAGVNPLDYIQFYSLRTWGVADPHARLVTSQIYTHSKVMIVDDKSCIFGSPRVSTNSVKGGIDNHAAIVMQDKKTVRSKMDGKDYEAGVFCGGLRQRLMREHLGCDLELVQHVDEAFTQYHEYSSKHYSELHTINKRFEGAASRESYINSSVIELAMRELFDLNCTAAWSNIHGDEAPLQHPHILETGANPYQYRKQLNYAFSPYKEQFIGYMTFSQDDDFYKVDLLKSLLYLQYGPFGKKTISLFSALTFSSLGSFVSCLYKLANVVDPFSLADPLDESFCEIWHATASKNTAIFRSVFYCQPDDLVRTQDESKLFAKYEEMLVDYQRELGANALLEVSFEPIDDFIASSAKDEATKNAVLRLSAVNTQNKVAARKRIANELLCGVIGHLVLLPSHSLPV